MFDLDPKTGLWLFADWPSATITPQTFSTGAAGLELPDLMQMRATIDAMGPPPPDVEFRLDPDLRRDDVFEIPASRDPITKRMRPHYVLLGELAWIDLQWCCMLEGVEILDGAP